jgi:hypothetical protein
MPPPALPAPRSLFVTVLGWCLIVASALASVISFFTVLIIVAGSYGTSSGMTLEGLTIILGPPLTLVAGIALLYRKPWARFYLIALICVVLAFNGYHIIRGPTPQSTQASADGVVTTRLESPAQYSLPVIALCIGLLLKLFSPSIRSEFGTSSSMGRVIATQWRVGHQGRDRMYYEEERDGEWQRIEISGEMLMGQAHHVIYFDPPERWQSYPEWARNRRAEIISRIKSEFREPDYEYYGDGEAPSSIEPSVPPILPSASQTAAFLASQKATPKQMGVLGLFILVFLAIAGGMFWLVNDGIHRGETLYPTKRATQRRSVSLQQEPTMFWTSLGLYGFIGLGSSVLALWFIQQGWKEVQKIRR